jgi:Glutamine amidotransferases class-II
MCMLCVVPPNVIPSRDKLENSALNNPHGFGYAIAVPKEQRIHVFRTMDADECINRFIEDRAKYYDGYAIWHARFATHGSNTIANCHPFKVGADSQTYLAHNGILSVVDDKDDRSDTRIFAEDLLPRIGGVQALDDKQVWNMLEDFTTGSKVAVLTVNPQAQCQLYLLHEEKGQIDASGVWWSNNSCELESWYSKYGAATYAKRALGALEEDEEFLECHICETVVDYWNAVKTGTESWCATCGSCYECNMYKNNCLCYAPKSYDNRTAEHEIPSWGW